MCLAVPARVVRLQDGMATVEVEGVRREASLLMLTDAAVGDYVIVHAGFAIQTLSAAEAEETLAIIRRLEAGAETSE